MASAIEDVSNLPGQKVLDQEGVEIGKVEEIYAVGDNNAPMWVTIESSTGMGESRAVFVPLARMKEENEDIRVPYSVQHIQSSPEVEPQDELSEEDDRRLRDYYAIDLADQELRADNEESYAKQVPEEDGQARRATEELGSDSGGPESRSGDSGPQEADSEPRSEQDSESQSEESKSESGGSESHSEESKSASAKSE